MTRKFVYRIIAPERVDEAFDDNWIAELARSKLPIRGDLGRFGADLRSDVRIYTEDVRTPTRNERHGEIRKLNSAAQKRSFKQVADLLRDLSFMSRAFLNERGLRWGVPVTLPQPEALLDEGKREQACVLISRLCQYGGAIVDGRMRPTGRRSRTFWSL